MTTRILLVSLGIAAAPVAAEIVSVSSPPAAALVTPHRIETLAENLEVPWELRFLPDGGQIFTERTGRVRLIQDGKLQDEPALTLAVAQGNKMGLLGLALSPKFEENGHVFLAWNRGRGGGSHELRIERHRLERGKLVEPFPLLEGILANRNHTGCRLEFGPDGMLYVTTGDADDAQASQDLRTLHGKILRIDPTGNAPPGNPFVDEADARPEIWSYGHRNPQGLAFQPGTGRLFASEHGPLHGDELNLIERGANYGWPLVTHRRTAEGMAPPLLEISPAVGPGRLLFYQGSTFPELRGTLLMATLRGSSVFRIILDADGAPVHVDRLWTGKWGRIRFIAEAPDGSLWLGTSMHDPPEGAPGANDDRILRILADPQGKVEAAGDASPRPLVLTPKTRDPERLVAAACAACHGERLVGGMQRGLLQGDWKYVRNESDLARVIGEGIPDVGMPGAEDLLTSEQIALVAEFIRKNRVNR